MNRDDAVEIIQAIVDRESHKTVDDAWKTILALLDEVEALRADAERYRWIRRKICFSGNGDGSASMHVINLPDSPYFPECDVEDAADQAIDAARHAQGDKA